MKMLVLLIAVLTLAAAACSSASDAVAEKIAEEIVEAGSDGAVDVDVSGDGDDVTVNVETEEGSLSIGTGAEMPEGLEIPVPDGGNVTASGTQDEAVFVTLTYPGDRYGEIVAFYESWTGSSGDEWDSQSMSIDVSGETQRTDSWTGPEYASMIIVTDCYDAESGGDQLDAVCVSINQGA